MKKLVFVSAAALLSFMSMQAQTDNVANNGNNPSKEEKRELKREKKQEQITRRKQDGSDANYQSKETFYTDFGNHPEATWKTTSHYDEATFNNEGIRTIAYYDFNAQLVGTTCMKTFADLPQNAQKTISKNYKDYAVKDIVFFDDNELNDTNMMLFGNEFDDEDNYFVELQKENKTLIVQVNMEGMVGYFAEL